MIGGGLRAEHFQAFRDRFGIEEVFEFYGASEFNTSFVNILNLNGTVGLSVPGWALVRFDPETGAPVRNSRGRLIRVGRREPGLLVSRVTPRFTFDGYTDPKESEGKRLRDAFRKGDVWVSSGDIMRRVGLGHLRFVDRVGDTFRWKGENVATLEVERALGREPWIRETCVVGVRVPGHGGRAGLAVIVPTEEAWSSAEPPWAARALVRRLDARLPPFAVPVFLRIERGLERTSTLKNRRAAMREQALDRAGKGDRRWVRTAGAPAYEPLSADLLAAIEAGKRRL
ncbi:MAG: AMP-binding protein [Myxococcales bacterium]|nr:AMP-binding protein [Myxococcales bacterium]